MILIAPNPAWVPRLDGTAGGTALPFPGRKYMLSQVEPGTIEPSCVIASGVSEEMGALQNRTLMGARKPSTRRCMLQMGVFVKSQAHVDPTTCTVCSEFPAAQTG